MSQKNCFFNAERPCDLTCKAAFEVDDPVDNVDCYFIWLAHHLGESLFEIRRVIEGLPGGLGGLGGGGFGPGAGPGPGPSSSPGPPGSKGPKGFPQN